MRMEKTIALLFLILGVTLACAVEEGEIRWAGSLEEALAAAQERQQHILVEVYTQTCKWCDALAETTLADPGVVAFSQNFLWAKIDAREDTLKARNLRVFGYPTVILLDSSGQEVDRIVGYLRPEPFMTQIEDYLAGKGTFDALQRQVMVDSTDVELLFRLGEKYQQRGLWDQSLNIFERVVRLDPENQKGLSAEALSYQGDALRRQQKIDQAVVCFRRLMERYPDTELAQDALLEIGYSYQRAKRNGEAVVVYEDFLHRNPGHRYEDWVHKQLEKLAEKP